MALAAFTAAVYLPVLDAGFVWDDDRYLTRPALQGLSGLWRIWTVPGAAEQYYPVLHTAFWVEHAMWGFAPAGYHLVNLACHIAGALLFGTVLRRLEIPGAWFAAALFAVHPAHVSSVAWVAEAKNTVSLVFYLAAALMYLRYDESRRWRDYLVACGLFAAAALSKPMTVSLPAALLVLVWWKRGRLEWRRDGLPLAPWLVFGLATGLFASWVEHHYIGAGGIAFARPWPERIVSAGRAYWTYVGHLLWPAGLGFVYPHWNLNAQSATAWLWPASVLLTGAVAWFWSKGRRRTPLALWLLFTGTLLPVLGFVPLYGSLYSAVWDHWQYLPDLIPIAGLGAAAAWVWTRKGRFSAAFVKIPAWTGASLVLAGLGSLSFVRSETFHDREALYRAALRVAPDSWMAENNLAIVLKQSGRAEEALPHYARALQLGPESPEGVEDNWGIALAALGRYPEAIAHYEAAFRLRPGYAPALHNMAATLVKSGHPDEALPYFRRAMAADPARADYRDHYAATLNDLAIAEANAGDVADAMARFREVVRLRPDSPEARENLAAAEDAAGRQSRHP